MQKHVETMYNVFWVKSSAIWTHVYLKVFYCNLASFKNVKHMNFVAFDLLILSSSLSYMDSSCWCHFHNKYSTCTPTLATVYNQSKCLAIFFVLLLLLLFKNLGIYLFAHSCAVYLNMCSTFLFFFFSFTRCNRFVADSMRLCRKRAIRFIFTSQKYIQ